jgi:hypothetical protein
VITGQLVKLTRHYGELSGIGADFNFNTALDLADIEKAAAPLGRVEQGGAASGTLVSSLPPLPGRAHGRRGRRQPNRGHRRLERPRRLLTSHATIA